MRIEIKTDDPVKDVDLKALFILHYALLISSKRMRQANLNFILDKWGFQPAQTK